MSGKRAWKNVSPLSASSYIDELMGVPRDFAFGWLAGMLIPLATVCGIVGGIYLLTRKVPFITDIGEDDGERRLIVRLVEPEEARGLFQKGREAAQAFGDEIRSELEGEQQ